MLRHIGVLSLCACTLFYACSCGTMKEVPMDDFHMSPHAGIRSVLLKDGTLLKFDISNRRYGAFIKEEIVGDLIGGKMVHIPVSNVSAVSYYDARTTRSLLLVMGIAVPIIALYVAASGLGSIGSGWNFKISGWKLNLGGW